MYFEVIDNKIECYGFYADNKIHNTLPDDAKYTWSYNSNISLDSVEYMNLYVGGKDIKEICPPHLQDDWKIASDRLKAYLRSFMTAKINPEHNCFYDLVPERFLIEYFSVKSKITQWVRENYPKPENYDFLVSIAKFTDQIKRQKLNIDLSPLDIKIANTRVREMRKRLENLDSHIRYDMFGTLTGRFSTDSKSFPILSLDKQYRSIIKPNNDWYVELDFNGVLVLTTSTTGQLHNFTSNSFKIAEQAGYKCCQ